MQAISNIPVTRHPQPLSHRSRQSTCEQRGAHVWATLRQPPWHVIRLPCSYDSFAAENEWGLVGLFPMLGLLGVLASLM